MTQEPPATPDAPPPGAPEPTGEPPRGPARFGPANSAAWAPYQPYAPLGDAPAPDPYGRVAPVGAVVPGVSRPEDDAHRKSFLAAWLFALLLGYVGADRLYLGKLGTGLLKLITCGGLGIWYLVDVVLLVTGSARDRFGHRLAGYEAHKVLAVVVTIVYLLGSVAFSLLMRRLGLWGRSEWVVVPGAGPGQLG